jgi:purine-binding chemotaxis protein CheW
MSDTISSPVEVTNRMEFISFHIRDQAFCIEVTSVREIRGWAAATPLPQSPEFVRGVVNLRGTVLPIIDLGARLGRGLTETTPRHAIIVVELSTRVVGLLVDAVSEILTIEESAIQATPDVGCEATRECLRGIIPLQGQMVGVLSLGHILPAMALEAA